MRAFDLPGMAEPASTRRHYTGEAVDVSFDPVPDRHAAECVRGLPAVFDTDRRPWILLDGADPENVVRVVARCPTGALRTNLRASATPEQPTAPTEVIALPGGPVLLRGDLHLMAPRGGDEHETRAALCACGATRNAPCCDGGGTCADWPHPGARVVICDAVSQYNATQAMAGPSNYIALLVTRSTMSGFVVFDYAEQYAEATRDLSAWLTEGRLTSVEQTERVDIAEFPAKLQKLFGGENTGKLVLELTLHALPAAGAGRATPISPAGIHQAWSCSRAVIQFSM
jgi:uncharacterized Fe-S cluster protein YjdI